MSITIDEMLDLLSFAGTERANGNANHGRRGSVHIGPGRVGPPLGREVQDGFDRGARGR